MKGNRKRKKQKQIWEDERRQRLGLKSVVGREGLFHNGFSGFNFDKTLKMGWHHLYVLEQEAQIGANWLNGLSKKQVCWGGAKDTNIYYLSR